MGKVWFHIVRWTGLCCFHFINNCFCSSVIKLEFDNTPFQRSHNIVLVAIQYYQYKDFLVCVWGWGGGSSE